MTHKARIPAQAALVTATAIAIGSMALGPLPRLELAMTLLVWPVLVAGGAVVVREVMR